MKRAPELIDVEQLNGRMLDGAVAIELMGWTRLRSQDWEQERIDALDWPEDIELTGDDPELGPGSPDRRRPIPPYSSDQAAAFEVEQKVEALGRGAVAAYGRELAVAVLGLTGPWEISARDVFALAHATPEQRCRAALLAARGATVREATQTGPATNP